MNDIAASARLANEDYVLRAQAGGVVTLTLNRAAQFNPLSEEMLGALERQLDEVASDASARVVILAAAGCQLVAACDLAIASSEARFATSGINLGLFCATPSVAVSRNVAAKKAFEMLFTGEFLSADEALAAKIVEKSPLAVSMGKAMFYRQLAMGLPEAYHYASGVMADNMMALDAQNGIDAFIDKKPPPKWLGK